MGGKGKMLRYTIADGLELTPSDTYEYIGISMEKELFLRRMHGAMLASESFSALRLANKQGIHIPICRYSDYGDKRFATVGKQWNTKIPTDILNELGYGD